LRYTPRVKETAQKTGSYRDLLKRELESRCGRNPRYSLRAFAKDLGLSAPRLSHVLNGRFGLSRAAAEAIADKLGLVGVEAEPAPR
jgi:hypothetical protein